MAQIQIFSLLLPVTRLNTEQISRLDQFSCNPRGIKGIYANISKL